MILRTVILSILKSGQKGIAELIAAVPSVLPLQAAVGTPLSAVVESELVNLTGEGLVARQGSGFVLTPAGLSQSNAARAEGERLKRQFRGAVEGRLTAVVNADKFAKARDFVQTYLEESCTKRALALGQVLIARWGVGAELQRVNVLSSLPSSAEALADTELALITIRVVGELLAAPAEVEQQYLGRLLQASFAGQLLGLEPESLTIRRNDLASTRFVVDSNIIVTAIAKGSVGHKPMRTLLATLGGLDAKLTVTQRIADEVRGHAAWAQRLFDRHGGISPVVLDVVEGRNSYRPNLFVTGFVAMRAVRPGLTWQSYMADCFGLARMPSHIDLMHIEGWCITHGIEMFDLASVGDQVQFLARREQAFEKIKERRLRKNTFRDEHQVTAEAEVVTLIDALGRRQEPERALFVSNTRILDEIPDFNPRMTIGADGLLHWVTSVAPGAGDEEMAFQAMVFSLYQEGISLFDRRMFRAVFAPLISASEDRFSEVLATHRAIVEDLLGPDPERAFDEVDDLTKPLVLRTLQGKVAERLQVALEAERRLRRAAEAEKKLSVAERRELDRLLARKKTKRARAVRKKRAAASGAKKRSRK
jgi:hypothetical protein